MNQGSFDVDELGGIPRIEWIPPGDLEVGVLADGERAGAVGDADLLRWLDREAAQRDLVVEAEADRHRGLLLGSLFVWHRTLGTVSVRSVSSPKAEMFYWVTIMFSQTLGTALGDWTAGTAGLGYTGGAMVFGALLAVVVASYFWSNVSRTILFWAAFILTRPLGAVVGDFLDKPLNAGGLDLSRYWASAALLAFMLSSILLFKQRAAKAVH